MSHQRFPSIDPAKEPHSVSLKVLRLSRPSLVPQHTLVPPTPPSATGDHDAPGSTTAMSASLAYADAPSNPHPFMLTPILNLPPSFGSAYVGETFSCTLCANHDALDAPGAPPKFTRDVRIDAEMKTPGSSTVQRLALGPPPADPDSLDPLAGTDLAPGHTLQRIVNFDLKEEGNHVLAVTVSYYEATDTSGKARTFRKLYQFICKGSLIVRTKVSPLLPSGPNREDQQQQRRRWVMEAQLENCSEDVMQLESVGLDLEPGLAYTDCNWDISASQKPVLHPADVEQCCFIVEEAPGPDVPPPSEDADGRLVFGVLGIGWRSEMGNKGFLTTGKLGARVAR